VTGLPELNNEEFAGEPADMSDMSDGNAAGDTDVAVELSGGMDNTVMEAEIPGVDGDHEITGMNDDSEITGVGTAGETTDNEMEIRESFSDSHRSDEGDEGNSSPDSMTVLESDSEVEDRSTRGSAYDDPSADVAHDINMTDEPYTGEATSQSASEHVEKAWSGHAVPATYSTYAIDFGG